MTGLVCIKPISIELVPVDGYLTVMVDPKAVLDNPDAADMVAEVLRGIGAARGMEVLIYGGCITDALRHLPPLQSLEKFLFSIPH